MKQVKNYQMGRGDEHKEGPDGYYCYVCIEHKKLGTFYVGVRQLKFGDKNIKSSKKKIDYGPKEVWEFMRKEPKTTAQWKFIKEHSSEICKAAN